MVNYVGIDLGGTKIAGAVFNAETGKVVTRKTIPTEAHEGPDAVLQRIAGQVQDLCQGAGLTVQQIGGVGIGAPGTVDIAEGLTLLIPNMPGNWYRKPVVSILQSYLDCPVALINDARAFTLAEATWGAGRGVRNIAGMTLGTGIGGGIALNGQLYMGIDGACAEMGHQTIDPNGDPCGCGNRGCLETFASGPAIAAMGVRAVMNGRTTIMGKLVDYDLNRITPEVIMRAAEADDAIARDILWRAGTYLGIGVSNVVTLLGPDRVILGGGVSRLGNWILKPVRATLEDRCRAIPIDRVEVVIAALGEDAGVIGAAMWAAQQSANT